jgi:hypothetical protein
MSKDQKCDLTEIALGQLRSNSVTFLQANNGEDHYINSLNFRKDVIYEAETQPLRLMNVCNKYENQHERHLTVV